MIKKYKKQITNSFIYTFSTVVSKAIPFLLLPIFTTYLTQEDYGVLGLISSIISIAGIYIGLKPSLFLIVKIPQMSKDIVSTYIFNSFFIGLYTFLIGVIVLLIVKYIFFQTIDSYVFIMIAFFSFFSIFGEILEIILQIEKKSKLYALYQLLRTFAAILLALMLIIVFKLGWKGKFFSDIIVVFFIMIFSYLYLKRNGYITFLFDFSKQIEMIKYLFPLSFHVLGLVLMNGIDRLFLVKMEGLKIAGLYTVAYTIGATLGIVHDSLLKVWSPEFYKKIKDASHNTKIKILKFQYLYIIGSFIMYGIFISIIPYIFHLMVNDKFNEAYNVIPIVALGLTFEAIRKLFISYHYNLGKNIRIAGITLLAGILNMIFNYILIPYFGIMGAAYATLISYIVVAIITVVDVNKFENIPWLLK